MNDFRVLLVEDDDSLREALLDTLAYGGFNVESAIDGRDALQRLNEQHFGLIISDIQMEPMGGLELLECIRDSHRDTPVVLMTAFGSVPQAVAAIRHGAMDYLTKPVEASVLLDLVRRFSNQSGAASELVAEDPRTLEVVSLARRVAGVDISVLLSGPSGSGKEVFARFIHAQSARAGCPFVAVNCAAIPEQMLEAELFGHEKGAFTGAVRAREGKFESAEGGTLLLDEISEMDLPLQAKLLRVLQEREVERLGSNRITPLNVRVIATTNRNLAKEVSAGRFREDLFYRLNVFPLQLPPLSARPGDIEPLARRTLARYSGGHPPALGASALNRLRAHSWPGNVRELDNVLQRALVLAADSDELQAEDLFFEPPMVAPDAEPQPPSAGEGSLHATMQDRESDEILAVLEQESGHRGRAAERLGISPRTLRYKLSRLRKIGVPIPAGHGGGFVTMGR